MVARPTVGPAYRFAACGLFDVPVIKPVSDFFWIETEMFSDLVVRDFSL